MRIENPFLRVSLGEAKMEIYEEKTLNENKLNTKILNWGNSISERKAKKIYYVMASSRRTFNEWKSFN